MFYLLHIIVLSSQPIWRLKYNNDFILFVSSGSANVHLNIQIEKMLQYGQVKVNNIWQAIGSMTLSYLYSGQGH